MDLGEYYSPAFASELYLNVDGVARSVKESLRLFLPRTIRPHRILSGPLRDAIIYTSWHDYPGAILGRTERPLISWLRRNVRAGETWLDVGAHYGFTAIALGGLTGPAGRVFAFEPVARSADCIRRTMRANGLDNVRVVDVGLSDSAEFDTVELPLHRGMADRTLIGRCTTTETIRHVALTSIWPELAQGNPVLHGVKIDVQAMEYEVLLGMRPLLACFHPKIVIEFHHGVNREPVLRCLAECGYALPGNGLSPAPPGAAYPDDESFAFLAEGFR